MIARTKALPFIENVVLIPTHIPPHKDAIMTPFSHRKAMLERAAKKEGCRISWIEMERHSPSWTVDTVRQFEQENPGIPFYYLIGSDSYYQLHTWKSPRDLLDMISFIVVNREKSADPDRAKAYLDRYFSKDDWHRFYFIDDEAVDVASRDIRAERRANQDISQWVPDYIVRYIEENGAYD